MTFGGICGKTKCFFAFFLHFFVVAVFGIFGPQKMQNLVTGHPPKWPWKYVNFDHGRPTNDLGAFGASCLFSIVGIFDPPNGHFWPPKYANFANFGHVRPSNVIWSKTSFNNFSIFDPQMIFVFKCWHFLPPNGHFLPPKYANFAYIGYGRPPNDVWATIFNEWWCKKCAHMYYICARSK